MEPIEMIQTLSATIGLIIIAAGLTYLKGKLKRYAAGLSKNPEC